MAGKRSAGIVVYRHRRDGQMEVLLLHLAGPLWASKDKWHFPKGELDADESDMAAAKREFREEVGVELPAGELFDLGEAKQGPKTNHLWALEADVDLSKFPDTLTENVFEMEWPPRSGRTQWFPENDQAQWFALAEARGKVFSGLVIFLDRLSEQLGIETDDMPSGPAQQPLL